MDVRAYMTTSVVSVTGDVRVLEVLDMMKAHRVRRVPVVKGTKLIGLMTEQLVAEHMPSQATSLSVHELNYLLTKTTVSDMMQTNVVTISPDALLEEAAVVMRENRVSVLPVLENDSLVGIITETDIFEAFIDILGYYRPGIRLVIELSDEVGEFERVLTLLKEQHINIDQIAVYHENNKAQVVLQLASTKLDDVKTMLENAGYPVLSAMLKTGKV